MRVSTSSVMNGFRRSVGSVLSGALLWAAANACYMPAAQCQARMRSAPAPVCHKHKAPAPKKDCCGKTCLSPSVTPSAAPMIAGRDVLLGLLPPVAVSPLPSDPGPSHGLWQRGPPGYASAPLDSSPSRSPPLA